MADQNKVLIVTERRCGGTSLNEMMRCLLKSRCVDEPFLSKWLSKNREGLPCSYKNKQKIIQSMEFLSQNYHCVKFCINSIGIEKERVVIQYAIDKGFKIIFLWRKNTLLQALSLMLAQSTGVWDRYPWSSQDPLNRYQEQLVNIDIRALENLIQTYEQGIAWVQDYLQSTSYFDLEYSVIYGNSVSLEQRLEVLKKVCHFLGINSEVLNTEKERIHQVLSPQVKLNTANTYQKVIHNFEEVENYFGEKYGSLWEI